MKKLLIIIAIAIIPTLMSASSVSAAQEPMPDRIPFTNKPVTPGVPESYIGTYGQCPFYENAGEKGCYPPSDIRCNADWSFCEYVGNTPQSSVTQPEPTSTTNTQPTPQSIVSKPQTANSTQNTASNSTSQTNNDDQSTEMQAKPQVDPEKRVLLASADANKDIEKTEQAVEKMTNGLIHLYIAAFGIVMWIIFISYMVVKNPTFFRDALNWYKNLWNKITKRR